MIRAVLFPRFLELSLRSRLRRSILGVAVGVAGLVVVSDAIRIAIADSLGESDRLSALRKGIALDPNNPKLHGRLALFYSYSSEEPNAVEAVAHLRRATELNPYEGFFWLNLALAQESIGDTVSADANFARALELRPMSPRFRWIAGNYFLRTGRPAMACSQFQRLLEVSPEYGPSTFRLCLRALGDPEAVFERVLPPEGSPEIKAAFISFLSTNGELDSAYRLWNRKMTKAHPFSFQAAEPFLERLIEAKRVGDARSVWLDLERLGIIKKPSLDKQGNLVFNWDFEQDPLNAGFDWNYRTRPYLLLDFSDPQAYSGVRCLRLHFTAPQNEDFEATSQIIPVDPDQPYLLKAVVRSKDLSSGSGPRLRVQDFTDPPGLDVETAGTVGTTPWHELSLTFSTGEKTSFVRLSVRRPRSRTFPGEITGTFWLDAISLTGVTSTSARTTSNTADGP